MIDRTTTGESLRIERTFEAPIARVWRAFTDGPTLARWYALDDSWGPTSVELDLRVGGAYRFVLRPPGGEFVERGEFREIEEPRRLVYTCTLTGEGEAGHDETIVTIELTDLGDRRTHVSLTQTGFADEAERDLHRGGWNRFLDRLVRDLMG